MLRAYLQTLRLQNAFGLEIQPLRRAFTSISQPMTSTSRSTLSRFTHQRTTLNQSYASPLRRANNKRTFHKTSRLRDNSKPDPSNTTTQQEPLGLTARLKKLSREYGWAAVGVYLSLSVLDFPFCFLLVRVVGTDRIGERDIYIYWVFRSKLLTCNNKKGNLNISSYPTYRRWYPSRCATDGMNIGKL